MPEFPQPLKPTPRSPATIGQDVAPVETPTRPVPSIEIISPCERARRALNRALEAWENIMGSDIESYRIGSRSLTRKKEIDSWKAIERAVLMVMKWCGPGALPPELVAMFGQPAARRVILRDV